MQQHPHMQGVVVGGGANLHHAMLSPPIAGQSTFHPVQHKPIQSSPQSGGEGYYNVPVSHHHQHTHGSMMGAGEVPMSGVPHAHFRHPAELSYSAAEMRQS